MQQFIGLSAYFRARPELTGAAADFIRSDAFGEEVQRLSQDVVELARLTLAMLQHLALDPVRGRKVSDFVNPTSENIDFYLPFHHLTNVVGGFELHRDSPQAQQLLLAIQENLESRRFKAATMYRRLLQNGQKRQRRRERLAGNTLSRFLADASANGPTFGRDYDGNKTAYSREIMDAARAARDAVDAECYLRSSGRIAAIGAQGFDESLRGGFNDILLTFAVQHIVPPQVAATCAC